MMHVALLLGIIFPDVIVADQIGGWLTHGVGNSYGNGYDYRILNKWMISLIGT